LSGKRRLRDNAVPTQFSHIMQQRSTQSAPSSKRQKTTATPATDATEGRLMK